jgi:hypothetical protein
MLSEAAAQGMIDGLSAVALGASVLTLASATRGAPSALNPRLAFALGGICLFFAARALSEASRDYGLRLLSLFTVCLLPLAALILAEGVLRRHAPRALKALVTLGAVVAAAAIVATHARPPVTNWVLGGFVLLALAAVTLLLIARDRAALSEQENAGIGALMAAGLLLTLLAVTDFVPGIPGLSGIGAAAVAFVLAANPTSRREGRRVLGDLVLIGAVAAASAVVLSRALALETLSKTLGLGAILLALLLAGGAILGARRERIGRQGEAFARALARADLTSLDRFFYSLSGQPLLAGLRVAEGALLSDYDAGGLEAALQGRPVWTRAALANAPAPMTSRARDELEDLMIRTEATHALLVSASPLRIALLTLSGMGLADGAADSLALFGKLAAVAARDRA